MSQAVAMKFNTLGRIAEMLVNDTALSDESKEIHKGSGRFAEHYLLPISRQETNYEIKFLTLKAKWEAETAVLSSVAEKAMHTAYQDIIGMGPNAIPFILTEMKEKPGHWFWALRHITGENPILPEQKGRLKEMTKAWLDWGREHNYLYD